MKRLTVISLVMVLFCFPLLSGNPELAAPKPPQALESKDFPSANVIGFGSAEFTRIFHSPLAIDEIVDFYNNELGDIEAVKPGKEYRADVIDVEFKQLGVLKVHDLPRNPGVTVRDIRSLEQRRCRSDYFAHFRDMSNLLEKYTTEDYNEICKKYGYLELAYYEESDKMDLQGNPLMNDEILYREYLNKLEPNIGASKTAEEMIIEAQKLMEQGRMNEAQELIMEASEMQAGAQQEIMKQHERRRQGEITIKDNWDEWIEFLEDLDSMIPPTIVFIDTHPSQWTMDDWIHESIEW